MAGSCVLQAEQKVLVPLAPGSALLPVAAHPRLGAARWLLPSAEPSPGSGLLRCKGAAAPARQRERAEGRENTLNGARLLHLQLDKSQISLGSEHVPAAAYEPTLCTTALGRWLNSTLK